MMPSKKLWPAKSTSLRSSIFGETLLLAQNQNLVTKFFYDILRIRNALTITIFDDVLHHRFLTGNL
jgi:hypothetical protein